MKANISPRITADSLVLALFDFVAAVIGAA